MVAVIVCLDVPVVGFVIDFAVALGLVPVVDDSYFPAVVAMVDESSLPAVGFVAMVAFESYVPEVVAALTFVAISAGEIAGEGMSIPVVAVIEHDAE